MTDLTNINIAVIIPCHNEESTIAKVIADFKAVLPEASIYVMDNAGNDRTDAKARESGAKVLYENRKGKGYAVQALFEKIDAEYYIMVDGDDTYNASESRELLLAAVEGGYDMVVGTRLKGHTQRAFRRWHVFGNRLILYIINRLFRVNLKDILSGYRVFSRNFVKYVPLLSPGFEVETEMTLKALYYGYTIKEMDVNYGERPEGSFSKLNTFRDGFRVIKLIFMIFRDYRPFFFFSVIGLVLLILGFLGGGVVIKEFIETRYIRRVPLAVLSASTVIASLLSFITGLILDSLSRRFKEIIVLQKKNH